MGRTLVEATIFGPSATKNYTFLVDTGAIYVGLPPREIEELGLHPIRNGVREFVTASGVVELATYGAEGDIQGRGFVTTVIPAPVPLLGYEFLENLRLKVNPVSQQVEAVPQGEIGPPYFLTAL